MTTVKDSHNCRKGGISVGFQQTGLFLPCCGKSWAAEQDRSSPALSIICAPGPRKLTVEFSPGGCTEAFITFFACQLVTCNN